MTLKKYIETRENEIKNKNSSPGKLHESTLSIKDNFNGSDIKPQEMRTLEADYSALQTQSPYASRGGYASINEDQ